MAHTNGQRVIPQGAAPMNILQGLTDGIIVQKPISLSQMEANPAHHLNMRQSILASPEAMFVRHPQRLVSAFWLNHPIHE